MYFTSWDRFVQACYELCRDDRARDDAAAAVPRSLPRYCLRVKPCKSLLVIKVTNDTTCIKFKTRSSVFLNRFDVLNRQLFTILRRGGTSAAAAAIGDDKTADDNSPGPATTTTATVSSSLIPTATGNDEATKTTKDEGGGGGGGGAAKKKKKSKKKGSKV